MKSHTTNDKGFTLIETSIAMLVMMVVGLGATSLFFYAVRNNTGGAQRSLSMAIAQQRVEDLRGLNYDHAKLNFGTHPTETVIIEGTTPASAYGSTTAPATPSAGNRSFQVQTQVDPFPAGAATPTQKRIMIRVTPVNGERAASWMNQTPVEVVIRRSTALSGPNKL